MTDSTDTNTNIDPYAAIVAATTAHADAVDVNEEQKGGFDKVPARAGAALFRFKSYIETGEHTVQKGKGKGKKQNWADFEFELVHPDHLIGPDDNKFPDTISLRNINISRNKKAKYFKLFKAMNHSGKFTNFPQMLGEAFYGSLVHNISGETTYVNMEEDGAYLIGAPSYEADPIGKPGVLTDIIVPELSGDKRLFLFDAPGATAEAIKVMWDLLEISGEKKDGTPRKNWIQDKIRSANNFAGSFVHQAVGGSAIVVQDVADDIAAATEAAVNAADATADAQVVTTTEAPDPLAGIPEGIQGL